MKRDNSRSQVEESQWLELQQRLGYTFLSPELLRQAMVHRSAPKPEANAEGDPNTIWHNERLEFLGDAVLNLLISHLLFVHYPDAPEGILSQWRASLVNTQSLSLVSRALGVGALLHMGHGEQKSGGREKTTILADALEALLGAVYMDGGYAAAQGVVERLFVESLAAIRPGQPERDYKSLLQERLQGVGRGLPEYRSGGVFGAPHERRFEVLCLLEGQEQGKGIGRSKREAEQEAARQALASLEPKPL